MTATLWNELMLLPTARGLVHRAIEVLAQRLSQLILCPSTARSVTIVETICAELLRRDFAVRRAYLPAIDGSISLDCALAQQFGLATVGAPTASFFEDLLPQPDWPDVLILDGFDELPESSQERWLSLLKRWSHAGQKALTEDHAWPALCCVAMPRAGVQLPTLGEACLKVAWWWGLPSTLELQLLCRIQSEARSREACDAWREHLLPSLASGDVEFFAELWPGITGPRTALWETLRDFGARRGWYPDALRNALSDCRADVLMKGRSPDRFASCDHSRPLAQLLPLWFTGLLQSTPEYGCELHTAALAVLGETETVDHRLWRAEAGLILPILDAHRHLICADLAHRYGDDWALRWRQPVSAEEVLALQDGALACQWGYLETLLRNCKALRRERKILPFVSHCRRLRNTLAHYKPVEFIDFKRLWDG